MAAMTGGVPPLFAHAFRHNYRMRMRALGLDGVGVSALMGHRWIQSSAGYGRAIARQQAKVRLRERLAALPRGRKGEP